MEKSLGRISSFQTLGTLDGPGVRFIVFLQGCPLCCICCHNPETWDIKGGTEYTAEEIVKKIERYKDYFGKDGGVTVSGGEPLLQANFCKELFSLCKEKGINTCLDTSGFKLDGEVEELLDYTDYCLLDIKYTNDEDYKKYTGIGISAPLEFLKILNAKKIPTRIRQVIIPGLNDGKENIERLKNFLEGVDCIEKTEFLPFRKLCVSKYEKLGLDFKLKDTPETSQLKIEETERYFKEK